MQFTPVTVRPPMGDILILLNDGQIHEGEYVRVLDENEKVQPFFHIYKTSSYILPMMVKGWCPKSNIVPYEYVPQKTYLSKRKKKEDK